MKYLSACLMVGALAVSGCAYPVGETFQGGTTSALSLEGLPLDALVYVDGASVGTARDWSGKVIAVSPGTHRVSVQQGGQAVVDREFYVGRESTVKVAAQ
jgi:hypothetical protein